MPEAMIETIERLAALTGEETGRRHLDPRVLEAMARVPRHALVPEEMAAMAYANSPLPIGSGQTISQPFIVALMTDLLEPRPNHRVLEVGAGSGYQAAVLAELVARVCTIEIIGELGKRAAATLHRLGYANVQLKIGDGYHGWQAEAPFDGVIVTAVADHVPPPLIAQLKPGGLMVIPLGKPSGEQILTLLRKRKEGEVASQKILPVQFVPLTGGH